MTFFCDLERAMGIEPDHLLGKLRLAFAARPPRPVFSCQRPYDHRLMLTLAIPQSICLSALQEAARPGFSPSHG